MRRFTDVYAYVNYTVYKDMVHGHIHILESIIQAFKVLSVGFEKSITKSHLTWADTRTNLVDILKYTRLLTGIV